MKSWEIYIIIIFFCTVAGAILGAMTHGNEHSCMVPAGFYSIVYAILYGFYGFIVGVVLSPVTVLTNATVKKSLALHKAQQLPSQSEEAQYLLLRPASHAVIVSQTLLRPFQGGTETDPAFLLRASEKECRLQQHKAYPALLVGMASVSGVMLKRRRK